MDESHDHKPHPAVHAEGVPTKSHRQSLSIWFFVGILTLAYGIVLVIQGLIEFHNPPANELRLPFLVHLHPTLWWGLCLFVFGAFYTTRFRPGKG